MRALIGHRAGKRKANRLMPSMHGLPRVRLGMTPRRQLRICQPLQAFTVLGDGAGQLGIEDKERAHKAVGAKGKRLTYRQSNGA